MEGARTPKNRFSGALAVPETGQNKSPIPKAWDHNLALRARPIAPVKQAEGHATPFQVVSAPLISLDLYVHHHRTGLLDLANPAKLYAIAESGRELTARGISAEVPG